ncbi:quinone-dependent dihydroorotate dehydrogenase [Polynucleobacter asymbioticus]|uniref:Dihydroorotate dehydrogenase (quinone) n=1 Tax=Polynucleobacter asymbioticus (strain DSM 18221 / CIP 109841 / QLW-P1DMWA-1) TaxID=312153 RepID=PYRD_POLAQ|nr:quinone-dependent dihydroorotate dehydrogenase [Polynucleobacter asymbioticus]A4SWU5.1 RecName: Full=Dihydroorotate dehydrogenase (quinone); AltName: Full=DHOdehase; Short=DHOD; Short=DHODase; AltName: Full=Dihydroorotate oxidase [Polynucleobacter asymbioticus QLW-P1DMWA-1]ABP33959.1 dihydroorotate oxidase A [Polynucleobacter asymbioticus QLW-P1DMWA-1]APC05823.1 dihydroorotate dehydrogenase [Polynucleobacter asymbioticus]
MIDRYSLLRPWLFCLDPEQAHNLTLKNLDRAQRFGLLQRLVSKPIADPQNLCGIEFPNPVGLAAGLDKDGKHIDSLAALGFGFLEIGTVTPRPQAGNPKPRMFRLPQAEAIINRMGFNNDGVEACVSRVRQSIFWQRGGVLGLNIGKNAITPIEDAASDYIAAMEAVYEIATYITVNISSPNTQNLRALQGEDMLRSLLRSLDDARKRLSDRYGVRKPLFLKIAPDLDQNDIHLIADLLMEFNIDAVIATNTTISREAVTGMQYGEETGGLSGAPVRIASNIVIRALKARLGVQLPIIGVGGILSGADAREKIMAGASLVQLYSGLIYKGPDLVSECAKALRQS